MLLLWAGQFVNTAGLMMLVPIMPFYLEQMGTTGMAETQTWAGVAIAAPALALTVVTPLWGRVGDRIGRKWMVVRALLGLGLAMVVMAAAATPLLLVVGRLLQGTLGGVVEAAAAFAGSTGSDKKRGSSLGKSFSATAAGALVGPIAGGLFVGAGGLRQLMLVIAAAAVVLAVGCAAGLQEPGRRSPGDDGTNKAKRQGRRPSVMGVPSAVALMLAAVGGYFGVYGLIPVFAEQVRGVAEPSIASLWVGVLHSVMWGATLVGSFWWGKHNDATLRPIRTFNIAAGGLAASIAVVSLPLDPFALVPFRLVQGFCFAALAQSLFMHFSRHAPEEHKSSFISTANSFLLIGQSVGPLLAGPTVGIMPVAGAIGVMALMCALACVLTFGPARAEKRAVGRDEDDVSLRDQASSDQLSEQETRRLPRFADRASEGGVDVAPFRGWHIAPDYLQDLAARYATPWDQYAGRGPGSPAEAASVLRAWWRSGAIVRDRQPAFYAYEQNGPHGNQRGLLAAVHLDSGLLPHEEVIPGQVNGIAELQRTNDMNLDPVLLGYTGDGRATKHLTDTTRQAPLAEVLANDGQAHRIWPVMEPDVHDDIADELGMCAAFIADGHHRHAAARQARRDRYAAGSGPGPWDYLSALLVDVTHNPMHVAPVHRMLPLTDPRWALRAAGSHFRVLPLRGDLHEWLYVLREWARRTPAFVVVAPRGAFLLINADPDFVSGAVRNLPSPLRTMHATVLHKALIEELWKTPESPAHIAYEASARKAIQRVRKHGGIAVLLTAPTQTDINAAAAAGLRMPPKTTSFGPKPHPGLVLRTLEDTDGAS